MSLENLRPFADQHAIQSAAFAPHFSSELDVGEVSRLRAAALQMKTEFPHIADQHRTTVQVGVGQGAGAAPKTTMDMGGFVLERRAPSTVPTVTPPLRSIMVSRENIVIAINDYTRWDKFKADVERYLKSLLGGINAQKAVASLGLQISDVFLWKSDPADLDLQEVFSKDSPYLIPNAFSPASLLWHSHHGYLTEETKPVAYQQLTNINVARAVVSSNHQIQILTSHRATFPRPLYKFLDANQEKISTVLDALHMENKRILRELLTPTLQEKISLNRPKE